MERTPLNTGDVYYQEYKNERFSFKAYFHQDKLIFVIDETQDNISPNKRLIINPLPGEEVLENVTTKWDVILEQVYKLDLNEIRPKKDNLFEKLDIEYNGLNIYEDYINNPSNEIFESRIIINKEKNALTNCLKRLSEETEILNKSKTTVEITKKTLTVAIEQTAIVSNKLKNYKKDSSKTPEQVNKVSTQVYNAIKTEKMRDKRLKKARTRVEKSEAEIRHLNTILPIIKSKLSQHPKMEVDFIYNNDRFSQRPVYEEPVQEEEAPKYEPKYVAPEVEKPVAANEDIMETLRRIEETINEVKVEKEDTPRPTFYQIEEEIRKVEPYDFKQENVVEESKEEHFPGDGHAHSWIMDTYNNGKEENLPVVEEPYVPEYKPEPVPEYKPEPQPVYEEPVWVKEETLPVVEEPILPPEPIYADPIKESVPEVVNVVVPQIPEEVKVEAKTQNKIMEVDIELWLYIFLSFLLTIFIFSGIYLNNRNIENQQDFVSEIVEK